MRSWTGRFLWLHLPVLFTIIRMKYLSRWASQHVRLAVLLIISCEIANAVNGLLLGMNLLTTWPVGVLALLMIVLLAGFVYGQRRPVRVSDVPYWTGRRWLFGAFLGNFLLFLTLGGMWASPGQTTVGSQPVWGSSRTEMRADTLAPINNAPSVSNEAYYVEQTAKPNRQVGNRVVFVLLFFAGIFLTGLLAALACQLACAGYAGYAVIVFLLGVAALGFGFQFLSRAFEKVIRPWRQMSRFERRRVNLRALLMMLGLLLLSRLGGR